MKLIKHVICIVTVVLMSCVFSELLASPTLAIEATDDTTLFGHVVGWHFLLNAPSTQEFEVELCVIREDCCATTNTSTCHHGACRRMAGGQHGVILFGIDESPLRDSGEAIIGSAILHGEEKTASFTRGKIPSHGLAKAGPRKEKDVVGRRVVRVGERVLLGGLLWGVNPQTEKPVEGEVVLPANGVQRDTLVITSESDSVMEPNGSGECSSECCFTKYAVELVFVPVGPEEEVGTEGGPVASPEG